MLTIQSLMISLEGSINFPSACQAKKPSFSAQLIQFSLKMSKKYKNGFGVCKGVTSGAIRQVLLSRQFQGWRIHCSLNSGGSGRMSEKFSENDPEYVNSTIIEAVEVNSGFDGFFVRMLDGRNLRCEHNSPQGPLPDYAPHPAIVLKMEDGSDILLPIIVSEMPSLLLMAALRNVPNVRPTIYQVVQDMIEKMGYVVHLVRVVERVHEAYYAQLYLSKIEDKQNIVSFDLRPSDAINMAVKCKVPIQVNRILAYNDGIKVVEPMTRATSMFDGLLMTELDRPDGHPCLETKEFDFLRNMLIAAVEERYTDAAQWRDKLFQLRSKKNWK